MVTLSLVVFASAYLTRFIAARRDATPIVAAICVAALAELATMPLAGFREADALSPVYRQLATTAARRGRRISLLVRALGLSRATRTTC